MSDSLYFEVHRGEGPYLLLVHGFLSSRSQWLENLDALKTFSTPVVIELFGHGRSPAPADKECYYPENYVNEFESIRKALKISKWYVCGYSLGAGLTIRYAIEYPEVILGHIFTNSTSGFATRESRERLLQQQNEIIDQYAREGIAAVEKIPVHPRNASRLPERVKNSLLEDCNLLNPSAVARTILYTNGYASVREDISRNQLPALLICGRNESRFLPFRDFVFENMPFLEVVDLDAGHAVNAESPDAFNAALRNFIQSG
ncbi:MAG: alpha/beta fold hydrolase [Gammaproteobacteria bacterium]|nr:alpha/beta fold hydrolase [Gammaproteobacteria bacterium]